MMPATPRTPGTRPRQPLIRRYQRAGQDSNLSEPGRRAVSQVRTLAGLDAPDRIRTSASLEGERCHRFEPWRVWTRPTGFEPVTFGFIDRPLVLKTGG